ncbi:MAG: exodeoxyribonuclease VII small subunit [Gammaproteobacteria bacterium]|nr:exodeoxyribonuclease VII small subunit [Gammaproteobacteria bacterium]MCP4475890.1 exodeoxyribonuclease VII small subunit [Gammaproteobacteria bacterium]
MTAKAKTEKDFDFATSVNELAKLVERMESNKLTLEQSLELFERGIHLTKQCQQRLKDANQRVKILLKDNKLKDYDERTAD